MKQKLGILFSALFIVSALFVNMPAKAAVTPAIPKIKFSTAPVTEYVAGDRVKFNIQAPSYGGRVEYRVVLWEDAKKTYTDLWNSANGHPTRYYTKWHPYGNETFTLGWPITTPGSYRITVYVKRLGIPNNKTAIKGANCDSYMESVAFTVKPKLTGVMLDQADSSNGPVDPQAPQTVKSNINILAKNISLSNTNVEGDINILGDNASLNNITVAGNIIVDPGKYGIVNLNNVSARSIKILSGAENGINLNNVSGSEIILEAPNRISLEVKEGTKVDRTSISTDAGLFANGGSFGHIYIFHKRTDGITVDLGGKFDKEIHVSNNVFLNTTEDAYVLLVELNPNKQDVVAEFSGVFKNILMSSPSTAVLYPGTKVSQVINSSEAYMYIDKGAEVQIAKSPNGTLYVEGEGAIAEQSGDVVYFVDKSMLPSGTQLAGTANGRASNGYTIVDVAYGDDYMYAFLDLYAQKPDGTSLDVTQGKLYFNDGKVVTMTKHNGDDYYQFYLNTDGTLALPGGSYEIYYPSGDKWYVLRFTTKQLGKAGEYKSEIVTMNGKPFSYTRYIP